MLVDGVTVEYRRKDGSIAGAQARVIDFDDPDNNDWLAVNQFTVAEGQHMRRPDVVLFVNGLPLAVIELKNRGRRECRPSGRRSSSLQTYQAQIPALFATNAALVASDGVQARIGALGAGKEWFKPWRTITGGDDATKLAELQVMLEGVFEKRRFLDLVRHFIVFEDWRAASWPRRWPAITSSMPSMWRWRKRLRAASAGAQPAQVAAALRKTRAATTPGRWPAARRATAASAWCGTRRVRARA